MSCAVALAAALVLTDPAAAAPPPPVSFAAEPLYADIIGRAQRLHGAVESFRATGVKASAAPKPWPQIGEIEADARALAELDMKGHVDLKARGVDGDLKCILKGISEDLPRKLAQITAAKTGADQDAALEEMLYLLDDNAAVLLAPPKPPV